MAKVRAADEDAASDSRENANEEFGRGDQQFGGGPGDVEYGEQPAEVGREGVVAEAGFGGRTPPPVPDDEREGVVLPGTDDEGLAEEE